MILFKALLNFFCNLAKNILAGACIGLFVEVGVIMFILFSGGSLHLITVIVTYLFAVIIGVSFVCEINSDEE